MFTKQDLRIAYKRETGEDALVDGRKTTEYVEWMENFIIELHRLLDEFDSSVSEIDEQVKNLLGDE